MNVQSISCHYSCYLGLGTQVNGLAKKVYVSGEGEDSTRCMIKENPCKTLKYAIRKTVVNDIVVIDPKHPLSQEEFCDNEAEPIELEFPVTIMADNSSSEADK